MQSVAKKNKPKKQKKVTKSNEQKFGFSVDLEEEPAELPQDTNQI